MYKFELNVFILNQIVRIWLLEGWHKENFYYLCAQINNYYQITGLL